MIPSSAQQLAPEPAIPLVIGIGAGTGGVEALSELLAFDYEGPAIILVMKTRREGEAPLLHALRRTARLDTCSAVTGMQLQRNHVYLVPAGKLARVEGHTLVLEDAVPTVSNPIDQLFVSLAESHGQRAVAILLSGRGQDGSEGLSAVRRAGGRTLVQSPQSAIIRTMPYHGASCAEFLLNPFQLGLQLLKLLATPPVLERHIGR